MLTTQEVSVVRPPASRRLPLPGARIVGPSPPHAEGVLMSRPEAFLLQAEAEENPLQFSPRLRLYLPSSFSPVLPWGRLSGSHWESFFVENGAEVMLCGLRITQGKAWSVGQPWNLSPVVEPGGSWGESGGMRVSLPCVPGSH